MSYQWGSIKYAREASVRVNLNQSVLLGTEVAREDPDYKDRLTQLHHRRASGESL